MVRFLHTADWQIGMPANFLGPEARARYAAARVDVIRRLGKVAADQGCDFVLVCGDVFDTNQLRPQTVRRALDALRDVPVPVYLLPGNHDPLNDVSVFSSSVFTQEAPDHVHVLDAPGPVAVAPGVELVAAPWLTKFPDVDLVGQALDQLPPGPAPQGTVRIVVGHGIVDELDRSSGRNPARIATAPLMQGLASGRIHYVALGDRHSRTEVAGTAAIHYSGAPEPTSDREVLPGDVLVVEIDPDREQPVRVRSHHVASWTFSVQTHRVDSDADLQALDQALSALPDKDRTVVQLELTGTLTVAGFATLEEIRQRHRDRLGALIERDQHRDVVVVSDEHEWSQIGLRGFLASAVEEIRVLAERGPATRPDDQQPLNGEDETEPEVATGRTPFQPDLPDDEESARDALALLYRLTSGGVR